MAEPKRTIGIIGAGNMGGVISGALLSSGISEPQQVLVSDISAEKLGSIKARYGVDTTGDNPGLFSKCDVVILSVKPQVIRDVLGEIRDGVAGRHISQRKLVVSIAAGITTSTIESILYRDMDDVQASKIPIIRVMPNTPALVLSGMSAACGNRNTTSEDLEFVNRILRSMGKALAVKENEMDAVTALSGSGPAYVFYLAEAMVDAGISLGFDPQTAATLTIETIMGAARLLQNRNESPEELRKQVTSPGGTTEAAMGVLQNNRVKHIMIQAIQAAAQRSKELSA